MFPSTLVRSLKFSLEVRLEDCVKTKTRTLQLEPWIENLVQNYGQDKGGTVVTGYILQVYDLSTSFQREKHLAALLYLSDGRVRIPTILTWPAWDGMTKEEGHEIVSFLTDNTVLLQDFSLGFQWEANASKSQFFLTISKLSSVTFGPRSDWVPCCSTRPSVKQKIAEIWRSQLQANSPTSMDTPSGLCLTQLLLDFEEECLAPQPSSSSCRPASSSRRPSSSSRQPASFSIQPSSSSRQPPSSSLQPSSSSLQPPSSSLQPASSSLQPSSSSLQPPSSSLQPASSSLQPSSSSRQPPSSSLQPASSSLQPSSSSRQPASSSLQPSSSSLQPSSSSQQPASSSLQPTSSSRQPASSSRQPPSSSLQPSSSSRQPASSSLQPSSSSLQPSTICITGWHKDRARYRKQRLFLVPVSHLYIPEEQREQMQADLGTPVTAAAHPVECEQQRYLPACASVSLVEAVQLLNPWDMFDEEGKISTSSAEVSPSRTSGDSSRDVPMATSTQAPPSETEAPQCHAPAGSSSPSLLRDLPSGSDNQTLPLYQRPRPHHATGSSPSPSGTLVSRPPLPHDAVGTRKRPRPEVRDDEEDEEEERGESAPPQPGTPPSWLFHTLAAGSEGGVTARVQTHSDGTMFTYRYQEAPCVAKALGLFKIPDDFLRWSVRYLASDGSENAPPSGGRPAL